MVAELGVIEDVTRRTPSAWSAAGERVFLLGETREELSGSEWANVVHGHLGGLPPRVDLGAERSLAELLREAVGVLTSAHDLSDGGLAQALAEAGMRHDVGVTVTVPGDPFLGLFAESVARVLVTVAPTDVDRLVELAERHGVPLTALGETGGTDLVVDGQFSVPLATLRAAWTETLPKALA